ncbi:hypothetical protein SASC598O11_002450, partial [Snodgrassella alvi SCGC AB-598-O11]
MPTITAAVMADFSVATVVNGLHTE